MKKILDMDIPWQGGWLSWVSATTMCLRALKVDVDSVDVAAHSGYAFAVSVNKGLCPSGPTFLDWSALSSGIIPLGRSATSFVTMDCFEKNSRNEHSTAHARHAFEIVTREIEADRPCVFWGLGVPEFGVVKGVDGDDYVCVAGGPTPERCRWDEIEAPGGPYVLAFPTQRNKSERNIHRDTLRQGYRILSKPDYGPENACGMNAWRYWMEQLVEGKAISWSNSYNAQCWAEARRFMADYLDRLTKKITNVQVLNSARDSARLVADDMVKIAELFPFTGNFEQEPITDNALVEEATMLLEQVAFNEGMVIDNLKRGLDATL